MTDYLIFRLYAPLAAFGDTAVGEMRPSRDEPAASAVLGLLAAAKGIDRDSEDRHNALRDECLIAVARMSSGRLLRDYHTAQAPEQTAIKSRPHCTRRDELAVPKEKLNAVLSTRDYRQDPVSLVAVQSRQADTPFLEDLRGFLEKPQYTLYVGRKSCPLAAPLWPRIETAEHLMAAFEKYLKSLAKLFNERLPKGMQSRIREPGLHVLQGREAKQARIESLHWMDRMDSGVARPGFTSVPRKDQLISRRRWQFGDRVEHIWLAPQQDEAQAVNED